MREARAWVIDLESMTGIWSRAYTISGDTFYAEDADVVFYVPRSARPIITRLSDGRERPVYIVLATGRIGIATDPVTLGELGVFADVFGESNAAVLSQLLRETIESVVDMVKSGKTPQFTLSPSLGIGVSVPVPRLAKVPVKFVKHLYALSSSIAREQVQKLVEAEAKLLREQARKELAKSAKWARIAFAVLLGVMFVVIGYAIAMVVIHMFAGSGAASAAQSAASAAQQLINVVSGGHTVTTTPPHVTPPPNLNATGGAG